MDWGVFSWRASGQVANESSMVIVVWCSEVVDHAVLKITEQDDDDQSAVMRDDVACRTTINGAHGRATHWQAVLTDHQRTVGPVASVHTYQRPSTNDSYLSARSRNVRPSV